MQSGRERLRAWMDRSKLNQKETAELLSIHEVMLSQLLNGVRNPGLTTALTIEDVTGIPARSWSLSRMSKASDEGSTASGKRQIAKR